jgi:enoyl-CoA hydratase
MSTVAVDRRGAIVIVSIDRPEVKNAVDGATATELADAFRSFERDPSGVVAILTGAGETFCAGADLKAIAGERGVATRFEPDGDGPMGPTRLVLTKPVIAAIEGHAVAGGLELALWCDMRVAAEDAVLGVFNRRWGIPLVDGGTVRLPRLIGHGRALDLILTGRPVAAAEALSIGLVDRVVDTGRALEAAVELGTEIARFPQNCVRSDRASALEQWGLPEGEAMTNEFAHGARTIAGGETADGAQRFASGRGRHGDFDDL